MFVKGPGSRLLWGNKALLSYYGMTQEQLAGIIDAPFVEPDLTDQYLRDDEYVFSSGKRLEIPEEPITRFDGEVRTFHTTKSPVFDSHGRVVLLVGRSTDITDRKKMEESLKKIEQEREALLESEKEARSAAERANQVKDQFLAMLSHELRTPLSTILAWTQLLRGGKLETVETMRGLEILEQSAKTQGQLIDDLLDISRIRTGKLTLNIKEFDPAIVIADAIDSTQRLADSKSAEDRSDDHSRRKTNLCRPDSISADLVEPHYQRHQIFASGSNDFHCSGRHRVPQRRTSTASGSRHWKGDQLGLNPSYF